MSRTPTAATPGTIEPRQPPRRPGDEDEPDDEDRLGRAQDGQRPEHVPVADLGDEHVEQARGRTPRRARSAGRVLPDVSPPTRETSTTADERQPDPDEDIGPGQPLEHDPDRDRDDGREHAGHRRDDAHPPDGEARVQRGDPDRRRPPRRARTSRRRDAGERLAAHEGEDRGDAPCRTSWVSRTTPSTGPRRPATPPPKSPAPHASADRRPKRTTGVADRREARRSGPGALGSGGDRFGGRSSSAVIVDARSGRAARRPRRRPRRSGRRRQVDDLEVGRDALAGARAPGVARASSSVTNGSSKTSGGRRSPVTSRTSPSRAAR